MVQKDHNGVRMVTTPSIKGSVFAEVVEDVNKLLARDELSDQELARWLSPSDRKLLETPISISSWYDIRAYGRLNELLRDVRGEGGNDYLRDRGAATANQLLEAGLYAQLEFLHRTEVAATTGDSARFEAFGRDLDKLTTLSGSILNFSHWRALPDPDRAGRYVIDITEAEPFPEVFCLRADGFVNQLANWHGEEALWTWDRPSRDRVVFRMLREL